MKWPENDSPYDLPKLNSGFLTRGYLNVHLGKNYACEIISNIIQKTCTLLGMRFVRQFIFFLTGLSITLFSCQSYAKPGDSVNLNKPLPDQDTRPLLGPINIDESPAIPEGMKLSLAAHISGGITALVSNESDLFVTSNKDGNLYRFRDRDNNGIYEVKSLFLTGFDAPQSLAVFDSRVFIADRTGIWRISINNDLVAYTSPELIVPFRGKNKNLTNPLLISNSDAKRLLISVYDPIKHKTRLESYENNSRSQISAVNGKASAIAVSPSGELFAAISYDELMRLGKIQGGAFISNLELSDPVTSIGFPKPNNESKSNWRDDIIISLGGAEPRIVRGHFKFGNLLNSGTEFISNFSKKSRIQGARTVWDIPGTITFNRQDELLFAGRRSGNIWLLRDAKETENTERLQKPNTIQNPESKRTSSTTPVLLPRGSSISYGSAIKDDPLLIPKTQNESVEPSGEKH